MLDLLVDNDAVVKLVRYRLEKEFIRHCNDDPAKDPIALLGTARWVCATALRRAVAKLGEDPAILVCFDQLLLEVDVVEPTEDELRLAAALEDRARTRGLPLDPGESQLAAVVSRRLAFLLTGDKRAIASLEALLDDFADLRPLVGRVAALENAIMSLVLHLGEPDVRNAVCSAPGADTALRLAFSCNSPSSSLQGLLSYLNSLRRDAPRIMVDADSLCFEPLPQSLRKTA
ncbi:hypothetical protein [Microbacterium pygmaeum]|uniref:Uncharacterized protein n=1 Tax=Microbacterium pygmaeum TaxID=370764 RepID=A0A1G7YF90_9MICO|nr:hypothetical protein [Microbacterium pygmaeum]SDG95208.1 hypothetical protein SAMN04489810_1738 [Microbacterium pygmaeum]